MPIPALQPGRGVARIDPRPLRRSGRAVGLEVRRHPARRRSRRAYTIVNHGGATGSALTNVGLINGLPGAAAAPGATGFGTGNIILGGDGSDIIEGRGGDDLIDGDKWLNVRISVRANVDGTGPEIASFDSMAPMIPLMLNGTYNPGQLVAVREIKDGVGGFDTANLSAALRAELHDHRQQQRHAGQLQRRRRHRDRHQRHAARRDRPPHPHRAAAVRRPVGDARARPQQRSGRRADDHATTTAGVIPTGDLLRASIAGVTDADNPGGAITGDHLATLGRSNSTPARACSKTSSCCRRGDLAFQSADGAIFRVTPDRRRPVAARQGHLPGRARRDGAGILRADRAGRRGRAAAADDAGCRWPTPPRAARASISSAPTSTSFSSRSRSPRRTRPARRLLDLIPNIRARLRPAHGRRQRTTTWSTRRHRSDRVRRGRHDVPAPDCPECSTTAEVQPAGFFGPGTRPAPRRPPMRRPAAIVFDSQPRTITNLIVDQTANNPAAVAAAAAQRRVPRSSPAPAWTACSAPPTTSRSSSFPNVTPDVGLTAPFNAWMTFFGQFFDHGLDLVTKGGSGTIFIPLKPDDPLYVPGSPTNFMVLTRATNPAGHPTASSAPPTTSTSSENTTTPFVDQNQTYTSHPSHQVFLRAYELDADGHPVATGKLITNRDLGADGQFGTADDDTEIGGMATWEGGQGAGARHPRHQSDRRRRRQRAAAGDRPYGNFIKGPNGLPKVDDEGRRRHRRHRGRRPGRRQSRCARSDLDQRGAHRPPVPDRHRPQRRSDADPSTGIKPVADADNDHQHRHSAGTGHLRQRAARRALHRRRRPREREHRPHHRPRHLPLRAQPAGRSDQGHGPRRRTTWPSSTNGC